MKKTYVDKWVCPKCGSNQITIRRISTSGKEVSTYCMDCYKQFKVKAGNVK